jgi:hypothetical protein
MPISSRRTYVALSLLALLLWITAITFGPDVQSEAVDAAGTWTPRAAAFDWRAPSAQPQLLPRTLWRATGLCAPQEVSGELVAQALQPILAATASKGERLVVTHRDQWTVQLGPYLVQFNPGTRAVSVDGPAGASTLARDIMICIGTGKPLSVAQRAGTWQWSDAIGEWRYVDAGWPAEPPPEG